MIIHYKYYIIGENKRNQYSLFESKWYQDPRHAEENWSEITLGKIQLYG
jgi:hypothetical protein